MRVMMITGAGISTGSGLATYRGANGRYTEIEAEVGMPIEQLLTPRMLKSDPARVWKYWLPFSLALQNAYPSVAHRSIAAIADACDEFLEVTQNVDGLSAVAGLKPDQVIELHGSYRRHLCVKCGRTNNPWLREGMDLPPRCYVCDRENGATIRPDVVMFNEQISSSDYVKAIEFANRADLLIIAGTSLQFTYLVDVISMAIATGSLVLYVDPEASKNKTIFLMADHELNVPGHINCVRKTADEVMPEIERMVRVNRDAQTIVHELTGVSE